MAIERHEYPIIASMFAAQQEDEYQLVVVAKLMDDNVIRYLLEQQEGADCPTELHKACGSALYPKATHVLLKKISETKPVAESKETASAKILDKIFLLQDKDGNNLFHLIVTKLRSKASLDLMRQLVSEDIFIQSSKAFNKSHTHGIEAAIYAMVEEKADAEQDAFLVDLFSTLPIAQYEKQLKSELLLKLAKTNKQKAFAYLAQQLISNDEVVGIFKKYKPEDRNKIITQLDDDVFCSLFEKLSPDTVQQLGRSRIITGELKKDDDTASRSWLAMMALRKSKEAAAELKLQKQPDNAFFKMLEKMDSHDVIYAMNAVASDTPDLVWLAKEHHKDVTDQAMTVLISKMMSATSEKRLANSILASALPFLARHFNCTTISVAIGTLSPQNEAINSFVCREIKDNPKLLSSEKKLINDMLTDRFTFLQNPQQLLNTNPASLNEILSLFVQRHAEDNENAVPIHDSLVKVLVDAKIEERECNKFLLYRAQLAEKILANRNNKDTDARILTITLCDNLRGLRPANYFSAAESKFIGMWQTKIYDDLNTKDEEIFNARINKLEISLAAVNLNEMRLSGLKHLASKTLKTTSNVVEVKLSEATTSVFGTPDKASDIEKCKQRNHALNQIGWQEFCDHFQNMKNFTYGIAEERFFRDLAKCKIQSEYCPVDSFQFNDKFDKLRKMVKEILPEKSIFSISTESNFILKLRAIDSTLSKIVEKLDNYRREFESRSHVSST